VILRRFSIVPAASRGVLEDLGLVVMFCVGRMPLLMRGYGGVPVYQTGIGCAGFAVTRAIANAPYAENSAHEPKHRECARENAEQGTDFRFSRSSQSESTLSRKAVGRYGVFTP
jgi:hypothetical protein